MKTNNPSNTKHAKKMRERRLLEPGFLEREQGYRRTYYGKTRTNAILARAGIMAELSTKRLPQQIRHHLLRGRDAGDIAIREGVPVSSVLEWMERMRQAGDLPPGGDPTGGALPMPGPKKTEP